MAGQSCPDDYPFVSGFDGAGALICVNSSGQSEPPPLSDQDPDIVFLLDATGDMQSSLPNLKSNIVGGLIPTILARFPTARFGVAFFADFPVAPHGEIGDFPYVGVRSITADTNFVIQAFDFLNGEGVGDLEEAGHEALYQVATGEGLPPYVSPFDMGFSPERRTIVIAVTSADFQESADYPASFGSHSRDHAVIELTGRDIKVIGVAVVETETDPAMVDLTAYAIDTGALLQPDIFGLGDSCPTGLNGAPRTPLSSGLCPLVFQVNPDGIGLAVSRVTEAIEGLLSSLNWSP